MEKSVRLKVRKAIIEMDKPFCIMNLLVFFEDKGITDTDLILSVLSDLYDEGIICYDEVEGTVDDPLASKWAFRVAC